MAAPDLTPLIHLDQSALRCPYTFFEQLRADAPVTFVPEIECFVVSRYDDIVDISRHPETFSSIMPTGPVLARQMMETMMSLAQEDPEFGQRMLNQRGNQVRVLLGADPPDHPRQRKLVNRAFTPPKVKALGPRIREVANQLVDAFAERGQAELVTEYGVLLPLTIIAECLGVNDDDLPKFKRWSDDFVAAIGNHDMSREQLKALVQTQGEFFVYFRDKIAERRLERKEDLISDVVYAELDGEPLSENEMLGMFSQFLVAGNETTTKLIASSVRILCEQPDLMARLREDPSLIAGFVEEALRLEAPVQGLFRTALTDTVVGGVDVPAGSHLMIVYASGNYDESQFAAPEAVDPCRSNAMKHLAFGHGAHYCLGAALARAEGRIAVETLLERLDDIAIVPGTELQYEPSYVLHGLRALPVTFTARQLQPA
jgi:cytochrome P450